MGGRGKGIGTNKPYIPFLRAGFATRGASEPRSSPPFSPPQCVRRHKDIVVASRYMLAPQTVNHAARERVHRRIRRLTTLLPPNPCVQSRSVQSRSVQSLVRNPSCAIPRVQSLVCRRLARTSARTPARTPARTHACTPTRTPARSPAPANMPAHPRPLTCACTPARSRGPAHPPAHPRPLTQQ